MEQAQRIKTLYDKRMETALRYVKNLNLPKEMREKVRIWFIYNWQQQKILGTNMAIHFRINVNSILSFCHRIMYPSGVISFTMDSCFSELAV